MPIGFAKSIFSRSAVAAAAGQGYSRGTAGTDAVTDYGYYKIQPNAGAVDLSQSNEWSLISWFRLIPSDFQAGKEYMMPWQIEAGGTRYIEIRFQYHNDGGGDDNDHSIICNFNNGSQIKFFGSYASGNDYFTPTSFANDVVDGSWHCLMVRGSATAANRQIYLDGANILKTTDTNITAGTTPLDAATLDFNMSTFTGAFPAAGANFDIGPTWFYDTAVDFSNSTNRGYYYNAGNTDGYVDGGTDGTAGGATQPDLYLYNTGTGLVNGGTCTPTISQVTSGSGTVTDFDSTNGPGSGNVRS